MNEKYLIPKPPYNIKAYLVKNMYGCFKTIFGNAVISQENAETWWG